MHRMTELIEKGYCHSIDHHGIKNAYYANPSLHIENMSGNVLQHGEKTLIYSEKTLKENCSC